MPERISGFLSWWTGMRPGGGLPVRAKLLIIAGIAAIAIATGIAFGLESFTRNNPRFCMSCHLLASPHTEWEQSVHQNVNCHDCHPLGIMETNRLLLGLVTGGKEPAPHGRIYAPWENCKSCHWDGTLPSPSAPRINASAIHSMHYFQEKIDCSKCHGYKAHLFLPDERFCASCHSGIVVHGGRMEGLACLNCHTDTRGDLKPDRLKCLYCHGTDRDRSELVALRGSRPDVRHFAPGGDVVNAAPRINVPADAPMRFDCYLCHKPHGKVRPDWGRCRECHLSSLGTGRHALHVERAGMSCSQCHKPHTWTVTTEDSRPLCTGCHSYQPPERFL